MEIQISNANHYLKHRKLLRRNPLAGIKAGIGLMDFPIPVTIFAEVRFEGTDAREDRAVCAIHLGDKSDRINSPWFRWFR